MPEVKPVIALEAGKGPKATDRLVLVAPDAIKRALAGPKVRVGFSVETTIYNWVRQQSARRRVTDTVIWKEAISTQLTSEWWAAHFEGTDPAAYFRARHKLSGRTRTTTDIPQELMDEIEASREELVEAFGSMGPRNQGMLLEAKILKWALDMAERAE